MNNVKTEYYKLVNHMVKKGSCAPKKHGEYRMLMICNGCILTLDTWNKSMVAAFSNGGKITRISLGIDFGGFECDEFWTRYFAAHI